MVKGTSRRVIVVRSPDPRFFEQAIFMLREDALKQEGVSAQQVVQEAKEVANTYLQHNRPMKRSRTMPLWAVRGLWFLAGSGAACLVWWLLV